MLLYVHLTMFLLPLLPQESHMPMKHAHKQQIVLSTFQMLFFLPVQYKIVHTPYRIQRILVEKALSLWFIKGSRYCR